MDVSGNGYSSKQLMPVNIDRDDFDNPQLVSVYVNDIYEYMRGLERTYSIKPRFVRTSNFSNARFDEK